MRHAYGNFVALPLRQSTNRNKYHECIKELTKCTGKHSRLRMTSHICFSLVSTGYSFCRDCTAKAMRITFHWYSKWPLMLPNRLKLLTAPLHFLRVPLCSIFCFLEVLGPSTLSSITESRSAVAWGRGYPVLIPPWTMVHVNYRRAYLICYSLAHA